MPDLYADQARFNLLLRILEEHLSLIKKQIISRQEGQLYKKAYEQLVSVTEHLKTQANLPLDVKILFINEINNILLEPNYTMKKGILATYPKKTYTSALFWNNTLPMIVDLLIYCVAPIALAIIFDTLLPLAIISGIYFCSNILSSSSPNKVKIMASVDLDNETHDIAKALDYLGSDMKNEPNAQTFFFNSIQNNCDVRPSAPPLPSHFYNEAPSSFPAPPSYHAPSYNG